MWCTLPQVYSNSTKPEGDVFKNKLASIKSGHKFFSASVEWG